MMAANYSHRPKAAVYFHDVIRFIRDPNGWVKQMLRSEQPRRSTHQAFQVEAPQTPILKGSLVHRVLALCEQNSPYVCEEPLPGYVQCLRGVLEKTSLSSDDCYVIDHKGGSWTLLHDEYTAWANSVSSTSDVEMLWDEVSRCSERAGDLDRHQSFISLNLRGAQTGSLCDTDVELSKNVAGVLFQGKADRVLRPVDHPGDPVDGWVCVDDWKVGNFPKCKTVETSFPAPRPNMTFSQQAQLQVAYYGFLAAEPDNRIVARVLYLGATPGITSVEVSYPDMHDYLQGLAKQMRSRLEG